MPLVRVTCGAKRWVCKPITSGPNKGFEECDWQQKCKLASGNGSAGLGAEGSEQEIIITDKDKDKDMNTISFNGTLEEVAAKVADLMRGGKTTCNFPPAGALCDRSLAPQSRAEYYSEDREIIVPDEESAMSTVLNALAPQALTTPLTICAIPVAKAVRFTLVSLDSLTSYSRVSMRVYVGDTSTTNAPAVDHRMRITGAQLDPSTNNGCVANACRKWVFAGSEESVTVRFVNVDSVALGAAASVRVQADFIMEGDPLFEKLWREECTACKVPYSTHPCTGNNCGCGCSGGE